MRLQRIVVFTFAGAYPAARLFAAFDSPRGFAAAARFNHLLNSKSFCLSR
jgi:hypothetical protein